MRSQPAMPRPGQSASLQALVYAPPGQQIEYRWSLCPVAARAKDQYACPLTPESAAALFGPGVPDFDLGGAPEAVLSHGLAPATLAGVCARGIASSGYADKVDCDLGFPFTLVLDVSSSGQSLRAAFAVYLPTSDDAGADNRNPSISDLTVNGVAMADTVTASPGQELPVAATLAPDAVEQRPSFAFESGTGLRSERLTFSWFADAGSWDKDRTSFIDGETTLAQATANPWTAPEPPTASATFAVVVRDDRGGVGWLERKPAMAVLP